jgi:hypothetical protein
MTAQYILNACHMLTRSFSVIWIDAEAGSTAGTTALTFVVPLERLVLHDGVGVWSGYQKGFEENTIQRNHFGEFLGYDDDKKCVAEQTHRARASPRANLRPHFGHS